MTNKWARLHGSEDMDEADKLRVKDILVVMGVDRSDIDFNLFVWEDNAGRLNVDGAIMEGEEVAEMHRPDVTIHDRHGIRLIIEVDGAVHRGGRKDRRRNEFYQRHKIPVIILNKADLAYLGEEWEDWLPREAAKVLKLAG